MAKNTIAYYPKEGRFINKKQTISGTASAVLFTAGTEGTKVYSAVIAGSIGTGNLLITITTTDGSTETLKTFNVTSSYDLLVDGPVLAPTDGNGNKYFNLPALATINVTGTAAWSAGDAILSLYGEDY